jgi:hypothetical protein
MAVVGCEDFDFPLLMMSVMPAASTNVPDPNMMTSLVFRQYPAFGKPNKIEMRSRKQVIFLL